MDIPREEIPWFPSINYEKCIGCLTCVKMCPHNVYDVEGNAPRPVVKNPYECVIGCQSCARMCPNSAINFPSTEELKKTLRELRQKYSR